MAWKNAEFGFHGVEVSEKRRLPGREGLTFAGREGKMVGKHYAAGMAEKGINDEKVLAGFDGGGAGGRMRFAQGDRG
jgi:hypothetical protein